MSAEGIQIEWVIRDKGSHASPTVGKRNRNTVNIDVPDPREGQNCLGNFRSRDVFAFPAKSFAGTFYEIKKAAGILSHEIPGSDPRIARLEDIPQEPSF